MRYRSARRRAIVSESKGSAGAETPAYLAWHPLDHIRWELARPAPGGGAGEGARFRIVEAFGRREDFYVDSTETVEKLDETGIRLVRRLGGVPIFQLEHTWAACEVGTHYVSVMDLGARSPLMTPVNRHLTSRVFPEAMGRAWLVHNIEEVGVLEHLLPSLWVDTTSFDPLRIVRADGVEYRFGPIQAFGKIRAPAWIDVLAPDGLRARLEITRATRAEAPAALFQPSWLTSVPGAREPR